MSHVDGTIKRTRASFLAFLNRPLLCNLSYASGVLCEHCPYDLPEGNQRWDILVRKSSDLRKLVSMLNRQGATTKVASISYVNRNRVLTFRQEEVVMMAIERGYYDFPRKAGLTQLSRYKHVDPSTFSEILRSAERKIMSKFGHAKSLTTQY